MAEERFTLTKSGYHNLKQQLDQLEATRAKTIPILDSVDDDGSNLEGNDAGVEYELQTHLEHLDERIGHIRYVLERATVETEDPNPHHIDPGEEVVLWDFTDQQERTFMVLDGEEAQMTYSRLNRGTVVSSDSPVGRALLGATVGDVIDVVVPDGTTRYAVRHITRPTT